MTKLARSQYLANKNPNECLLTYLALGKKDVVLGLFKLNPKMKAVRLCHWLFLTVP